MRTLLSATVLGFALGAGPAAQAQGCGSGGGATVCLTASGTPDNIQLHWTTSGAVTGLQVYRDTDANPNGRSRLATLSASTTTYTDGGAASNTPYWYWVRFSTAAGSYSSGAASATRNPSCSQASVSPSISVNGAWTATASATASFGSQVILSPQASESGSWSWNGCGTAGSAREQKLTASASCTATATFTRSCGTKTLQPFTLTVPGVMRDLTSVQLSKLMSPGINLGNTMEGIPTEQSWNPTLTTQATMDGFKAAGFKSVRIPVAWSQYADADNNISPTWLARVKQVVDYTRKAGLYAMINIHWDGGWLNHPTYDQQPALNAKLAKFWTQIANTFKDYDDYLLFAGTNEVGMDAPWGTPVSAEWAAVQNGFNQVFVDAVRATGGNNAKRHLVVQAYFTNIDHAVTINTVPTDTVANRLFMEAHYYDPFNFTINGDSNIWQWGAGATDPTAVEPWANEPWVDSQFQKMKTRFVDQGVAVIIGEFGAYVKPKYPGMAEYRKAWAEYLSRSMAQHGLVPMWWDTGELIDRATGAQRVPDLISTLVNAVK
jgi:aryl-phospho-beta-D-glucosidase BglC (GH1 family)